MSLHQEYLDVVADNLANVNTPGFKYSRVMFQDLFTQLEAPGSAPGATVGGANPTQVGLGLKVGYITPSFTQGTLTATGRTSDVAIQGDGFFIYRSALGRETYGREGSLQIDSAGYLVNASSGLRVQGWNANPETGDVDTNTDVEDIKVVLDKGVATATTRMEIANNLDAMTDATGQSSEYARFYDVTVGFYDSLGVSQDVTLRFTRFTSGDDLDFDPANPTGFDRENIHGTYAEIEANKNFDAVSLVDPLVPSSYYSSDWLMTISPNDVNYSNRIVRIEDNTINGIDTGGTYTGIDYNAAGILGELQVSGWTPGQNPPDTIDQNQFPGLYEEVNAAGAGTGVVRGGTFLTFDEEGQVMSVGGVVGDKYQIADGDGDPEPGPLPPATSWSGDYDDNTFDLDGDLTSREVTVGDWTDPYSAGIGLGGPPDNRQWVPSTHVLFTDALPTIFLEGQNGAQDCLVKVDVTNITQLSQINTVGMIARDGSSAGTVTALHIANETGEVYVMYSNGREERLGQMAMAKFSNPGGLIRTGGNLYNMGINSGPPIQGAPNTGGRGTINSGYLEGSNVDMGKEFTAMILAQRGFQASARVIRTADMILQELTQLKR